MPHAGLGNDVVREFSHVVDGPFEHDRLKTLFVIQVGMHRRDRQVMMRMLKISQPLG